MNKYITIITSIIVSVILFVALVFTDIIIKGKVQKNTFILEAIGAIKSQVPQPVTEPKTVQDLRYGYSELLQIIFQEKKFEILKMEYKGDRSIVSIEISGNFNMVDFDEVLNNLIQKGNVSSIKNISLSNLSFRESNETSKVKVNINMDLIKNN